jgi:hypothetical protein
MKNRSFLFLIAALAMGLALIGCSSDSDSSTEYVKQGYAGDAEAIEAAFVFADNVYLAKSTSLTGQTLTIPAGKTLHVNGYPIAVDEYTIIIGAGNVNWADNGNGTSQIVANGSAAVLIGIDKDPEYYGNGGTEGILFVPKDGSVAPGTDNSPGLLATDDTSKLLVGGSYLAALGGTTAYFTGKTLNVSNLTVASGGTLFVAGNLTGLKSLSTTTPLEVNGQLEGGTVAPATFITGNVEVTAKTANISGGQIATLSVTNTGNFTGKVEFTAFGANTATFADDVSFTAGNIGNAVFTSGITVGGNVEIGNISFSGTGNNLVLNKDGQIIFTTGITPAFFTGAGTLAALNDNISFTFTADELGINSSGTGAFTVNDDITLKNTNKQIKVTGSAGLYFTAENKKIEGDGYYFSGGLPGTLSASNYKGFILTKAGIEGASSDDPPTLKYTLADGAGGTFLTILNGLGSLATIKNANISLASGSIAFEGGGSATLFLDTGGSITASNAVGSLAHSGYIISDAVGGSLVAGSIGSMSETSIAAGSVGTVGNNLILITSAFAIHGSGDDSGSASSASGKVTTASATEAHHGGSVAVFKVN